MQELKFISSPKEGANSNYNRYETIMGNDYIVVDWELGNTCNYSCTYCHEVVNGGSFGWPELDNAMAFVRRVTEHYHSIGKTKIVWNLLGGEPTVWKNLSKFLTLLKEYDNNCIIRTLTNGSRTISWWKRNAHLFDEVILSWHPEYADYKHCTEVSNILTTSGVATSIQVCMYPPVMDLCIEAAEYYYNNSICGSISVKSLQTDITKSQTFEYDEEMLNKARQFDGQPRLLDPELRNNNDFEHQSNITKMSRPAYGKMMRFVNSYTGETEFVQANELMSTGRNTWKGWMCNLGIESLRIDKGIVTSGSSCFPNLIHGYTNDPDNIDFPSTGRICEQTWCSCIADVEMTKYRVE